MQTKLRKQFDNNNNNNYYYYYYHYHYHYYYYYYYSDLPEILKVLCQRIILGHMDKDD